MKYDQITSGEWVWPVRRGWRMRCCDCRLVHDIDFRLRKRRLELRVRRNERATAASRRAANG